MSGKIIDMKAWLTMSCDGFVVVGHRGNLGNEFETVMIPISGSDDVLRLDGRFNVIHADGLKDALQIHELVNWRVERPTKEKE